MYYGQQILFSKRTDRRSKIHKKVPEIFVQIQQQMEYTYLLVFEAKSPEISFMAFLVCRVWILRQSNSRSFRVISPARKAVSLKN